MRHTHASTLRTTALALALLAGSSASVLAQHDARLDTERPARAGSADIQPYHFISSDSLMGAGVVNSRGESVGSISDVIVDRGSGQIRHALVETGAVLGIGGKTIAVPFSRLGWNDADDAFTLDMSERQIEDAVAFDPEAWPSLDHETWGERIEQWWSGKTDDRLLAEREVQREAFAARVREGKTWRTSGKIVGIDRERDDRGEEFVALRVRTDDGETQKVILGPTWYVMGAKNAPETGDRFEGEVSSARTTYGTQHVALSASLDGNRQRFRNDHGLGVWESGVTSGAGDAPRKRLILLSDVIGAKAVARGENEAGEIQNAAIERRTGNVALLGFDPNENFLGLGDTIKCVPWSITRISPDGSVHIDATKDVLGSCEEMPEDMSVLRSKSELVPIYRVFKLQPAPFTSERSHHGMNADDRKGMGERPMDRSSRDSAPNERGDFFANFADSGTRLNFAGEVERVISRPIDGVKGHVRLIVLATEKGEREIVLAPESHLSETNFAVAQGDRVSVLTRTARVDGRDLYVAESIQTPDGQFSFWNDHTPAWAR